MGKIMRWEEVLGFNDDVDFAFVDNTDEYSLFDVYRMVLDYIEETQGGFDELPNPDCISIKVGHWSGAYGEDGDDLRIFTPDPKGKECYFINLIKEVK